MSENSSAADRQLDKPFSMSDLVAGEVWNGRLAMIGFISAIVTEVLIGQSLLPKLFWCSIEFVNIGSSSYSRAFLCLWIIEVVGWCLWFWATDFFDFGWSFCSSFVLFICLCKLKIVVHFLVVRICVFDILVPGQAMLKFTLLCVNGYGSVGVFSFKDWFWSFEAKWNTKKKIEYQFSWKLWLEAKNWSKWGI